MGDAVGQFILSDEQGSRLRPWQESVVGSGPQRDRMIDRGMTKREQEERLYTPRFRRGHDLTSQLNRLVETAPPIVKTSGLSKATRLTKSWSEHFELWKAMKGRPLVVGDLSDQMRKAFHMDTLPDTQVITKKLIERAARRYLRDSENQMREAQNKRVTKEPFWVPAGVR